MKKKLYLLLFSCLFLVTSCGSTASTSATFPSSYTVPTHTSTHKLSQSNEMNDDENISPDVPWSDVSAKYPCVTYDDIATGKYTDQYVLLSCVVENVEYDDLMDWTICTVWYPYKDIYKSDHFTFMHEKLPNFDPQSIQPNDNIDVCVYINRDNSFGNNILSYNICDELFTMEDVHSCVPADFYYCGNVNSDKTGLWRWSTTNTELSPTDYILFYYKYYFESDDELHAIINRSNNTTISVQVCMDFLDVNVHKYVNGEEKDASILFSGDIIDSYHVDISTGNIEYIE